MKLPDPTDTIAAQATPPGAGAIAVLRLTGPAAFAKAALFLSPPVKSPAHRRAYVLAVKDAGRLIDKVVAVFFRGPASYTGQDTVEISCHGSPYIIRTILNLAVSNGARIAAPGEFTLRAFLNGKLDLAQAEAVGELIASSSAGAHRAAITQAEGELSARVAAVRGSLVELLSEIEARLDDSYEEIPALRRRAFGRSAAAAHKKVLRLAAGFEAGKGIREGLNVVITGAPNSGKSSLLNALLGYDRALVSREAGTTRDLLEAALELDGFTVRFSDTAGLNAGRASRLELAGMARARKALAAAELVLLVKDASIRASASDLRAEKEVAAAAGGAKVLRVFNKTDLPVRRSCAGGLPVSCRSGRGLGRLRTALVARQKKTFSDGAQAVITSARHFEALSGAARELAALGILLRAGNPQLELAAERLRLALGELALISGETAPEEVLAGIFGKFCVGK